MRLRTSILCFLPITLVALAVGDACASDMGVMRRVAPGDSAAGPYTVSVCAESPGTSDSLVIFSISAVADSATVAKGWALLAIGSPSLFGPQLLHCRLEPTRRTERRLDYSIGLARHLAQQARFVLLSASRTRDTTLSYEFHLADFMDRVGHTPN